jgi:hypothetical protein
MVRPGLGEVRPEVVEAWLLAIFLGHSATPALLASVFLLLQMETDEWTSILAFQTLS